MSAAKPLKTGLRARKQTEEIVVDVLTTTLTETVITTEGDIIRIDRCTWYHGESLKEVTSIDDFITRLVLTKVDEHDASVFCGKFGVMYAWLYMFRPDYMPAGADRFGELAVRLGLLLLEYNLFTNTKHEDAEVYLKYTEYALKCVCIQVIMELVSARGDAPLNPADLNDAYRLYNYERENLPLLRLLAMAIKHTHDMDAVRLFTAKFAEIVKGDNDVASKIRMAYELGQEITAYLKKKYRKLPSAIDSAEIVIESVAEVVPVQVEVTDEQVEVIVERVEVVDERVTEQVEVVDEPAPAANEPVTHIPPAAELPSQIATTDDEGDLILPTDIVVANSRCCACSEGMEPQSGRVIEMDREIVEGRMAGRSDAAVDYVSLEKTAAKDPKRTAWFDMPPPPSANALQSAINKNQPYLIDFINHVISPIERISSDLIHNLAYTLATITNSHARNAVLHFVSNEFITNKFVEFPFSSYGEVKNALESLIRTKTEYSSEHVRATIAAAIIMQTAKQMLDADDSAARPLSVRYAQNYGMLKHVVAHIHIVEHMMAGFSASMHALNSKRSSAWAEYVRSNIVGRIIRRVKEALYAARIQMAAHGWDMWKKTYIPYYDGLTTRLLERIDNPNKNGEPYSEYDPSKTRGFKIAETSIGMQTFLMEVESLPKHSLRPLTSPITFTIYMPRIPITSSLTMDSFAPVPDSLEREVETSIIKAVEATGRYIDSLEAKRSRTDLRIAFSELLTKRAFFARTPYECMLAATDTPLPERKDISRDYTCNGGFKNALNPNQRITNMQSYLSDLYVQQQNKDIIMGDVR